MKRNIFFIVLITLISTFSYAQNSPNFRTPEIVMEYFVNNVKSGNFNNVFLTSPFYYDTLIERINPREAINYIGSILFQLDANMPIEYSSIIKYNLLARRSAELKRFIFCLLLSENYPEFVLNLNPLKFDDAILDNYFSFLKIQNLRSLELIRMDIFRPDIQFGERHQNNIKRQSLRPYGCDEVTEYTVLYRHNGNYYAGGVTLYRYGSNWYIGYLNSYLANTSLGELKKVSGVSEYLYNFEIK